MEQKCVGDRTLENFTVQMVSNHRTALKLYSASLCCKWACCPTGSEPHGETCRVLTLKSIHTLSQHALVEMGYTLDRVQVRRITFTVWTHLTLKTCEVKSTGLGHSLTLTGTAVGCEGILVKWLSLKLKVMWQNWCKNYCLTLKQWLLEKNMFVQSEKHSDMIQLMSRWGSMGSLSLNNMNSFSFDFVD